MCSSKLQSGKQGEDFGIYSQPRSLSYSRLEEYLPGNSTQSHTLNGLHSAYLACHKVTSFSSQANPSQGLCGVSLNYVQIYLVHYQF